MTTIMGRADLHLRQTTVAPGEEGVIDVFTPTGGSTIRYPEGVACRSARNAGDGVSGIAARVLAMRPERRAS